MTSIQELPNELLEKIFYEADVQNTTRSQQVSKQFHDVIVVSALIQYKIALINEGFEDRTHSPEGRSIGERLDSLRSRRSAWRMLQPTARRKITIPRYSLHLETRSHFAWADGLNAKQLHVLQIPSVYRGLQEKEWVVKLPGVRLVDERFAAMEPDEDLLAIDTNSDEQWFISLRSLTTGEDHPDARIPELPPIVIGHLGGLGRLSVSGNYLALDRFEDRGDYRYLHIYNWKTGELLFLCDGQYEPFELIDQYVLIAHSSVDGEFTVVSVIDLPTLSPILDPNQYTIGWETGYTEYERIALAQYCLPTNSGSTHRIHVASHPRPPKSRAPTTPIFYPDPLCYQDYRIVIIEMSEHSLVVPWSSILRIICSRDALGATLAQCLNWEELAPEGFRVMPRNDETPLPSVKGVSALNMRRGEAGPLDVRLYDHDSLKSFVRRMEKAVFDESDFEYEVLMLGDDGVVLGQVPKAQDYEAECEYHILSF
ncbi:hypothetical protein BXZ70DRAFT_945543 [Cristinia sonorae]|uniref:F-box domain-containing protein n=1 Tax=Cristinia sonorae TaxID=1940300 RepID=A0A8K0XND4_9AGAR|nr:hypothetical protein BXZ70DRAFT_945543 [Cristinia sonorae]